MSEILDLRVAVNGLKERVKSLETTLEDVVRAVAEMRWRCRDQPGPVTDLMHRKPPKGDPNAE